MNNSTMQLFGQSRVVTIPEVGYGEDSLAAEQGFVQVGVDEL